jgi:hypothetical protein
MSLLSEQLEWVCASIQEAINGNLEELPNALAILEDIKEPLLRSRIALKVLLAVSTDYQEMKNRKETKLMNGKFTRATMKQVLREPEGFLDKVMRVFNNNEYINNNLRNYIENMDQEPKEPAEPI